MKPVSDEELSHIAQMLEGYEQKVVEAMAYVKDAQGWSNDALASRFSNITPKLVGRYLQPAYTALRPLHFIAAFSWVTSIPMTSFWLGANIRESYRGMDQASVDALICIGNMPHDQFDVILKCIYFYLDDKAKQAVDQLATSLAPITSDMDALYEAPPVIDLDVFAKSYYRSLAKSSKAFRQAYNISKAQMARVLGLSTYKFNVLEDEDDPQPFSITIGARVKLGFKLSDHAGFSEDMEEYKEFHEFRKMQHARDMLLVESLRHLSDRHKPYVIEMIKGVAAAYVKPTVYAAPSSSAAEFEQV